MRSWVRAPIRKKVSNSNMIASCWIRDIEWLKVRLKLCYSSSICTTEQSLSADVITLGFPKGRLAIHLMSTSFGGFFRLKMKPSLTPMTFLSLFLAMMLCGSANGKSTKFSMTILRSWEREAKKREGNFWLRALDAGFKGWVFKSRKELHFLPFCLPLKLAYKLDIA